MPSEQPQKNYGVFVFGVVMSKNKYPGQNGKQDRFGIDVAVPGVREMISITVPPENWGIYKEMGDFKGEVSFRKYNGNVYFEAIP